MALPPLANLDEFESWESAPVTDGERAVAILHAASTLIRARTGRVWVDAGGELEAGLSELQREVARTVCLTVTSRVYNNPDGTTQESVANYSRSVAAWSAHGLALTEEELALLGTVTQTGIPGLWSARVVAPAQARATVFNADWWEEDPYNQLVENDGQ
jgi:hypothetical protein